MLVFPTSVAAAATTCYGLQKGYVSGVVAVPPLVKSFMAGKQYVKLYQRINQMIKHPCRP